MFFELHRDPFVNPQSGYDGPMPSILRLSVVSLALWFATPAHAQYSNWSLGLGVGPMKISADQEPIQWAIPISLQGTFYSENGFSVTARVPLMIMFDPISSRQIVGMGVMSGMRYLFSEEYLRPYAGLNLAFLYIFRDAGQSAFFGFGPDAGIDFFVSDAFSIGPRAFVNFYLALNTPVRFAYGGEFNVHTYF